ncbi:hypothetical protein BCR34DRAFT_664010 [Clohesyomyces aquaticus]|uniref:Extracellular membrane protein CFEM domain-containing protein n=1 Tax=Clohesyomyces aquaticus TaxID=1231657 RepID=A0A1Y1ZPE1_9PLEO|nr:hypothetical protein BCR34DRAFT_664010 [Clohesyomyces aquaticus]
MKTTFVLLSVALTTTLAAPSTPPHAAAAHDRRGLKAHPHALDPTVCEKPSLEERGAHCMPLSETKKKEFQTFCIASSSNQPYEIALSSGFCRTKGGNTDSCLLDDGTVVEDVCFDKRCLGYEDRKALLESLEDL